MTCIVGFATEGKVYMGADSSAVSGWTIRSSKTQKLFQKGDFLIGYTTSFRMGQILQYEIDFPKAEIYDEEFMVTKFIGIVREKFKSLGYTKIDSNQEYGGSFLVGVSGQLFEVADDFQVNSYRDGIASVGCGREYALGSLLTSLHPHRVAPETAILRALSVADYFSSGVSRPFTILSV